MKKLIAVLLLLAIAFMILLEVSDIGRYFFFDTVKVNRRETKMVAHRGASWLEVEGTEAAFEEAGQRSYFAIEADLRRTADGKLIICHDSDLKRQAGVKIEVEDLTLDELLDVPLKDKFGRKETKNRLTVLQKYVEICKKYDKYCFLELKSDLNKDDVALMVAIFREYEYLDRVTFISMNENNLKLVRELLPNQPVQYAFGKITEENISIAIENHFDVAIQYLYLTKSALNRLHDAGLEVNLWTINNKFAAEVYASWGVDYITTNILE